MEETKKSSKGLILLIIVLIVSVLGLGGYIVYDKVLNKNKQTTSTNNNNTSSTNKKEENTNLDNSDKNSILETYILENIDLESSYEVLNNEEYKALVKKYEDNANNIIENENEVAINNTISTEINFMILYQLL